MGQLTMRKISEILRQRYELNRSYRDIARSLNISISTVSSYVGHARTAQVSWPLPEGMTEAALQERLFPSAQLGAARPLPNWAQIHKELRRKGVTLRLLWREYRDTQPNGLGYSQFCNRYRAYTKSVAPVMRQVHKAGEKTFVDYAGQTLEWIDVTTGEIQKAQIFVSALGASQFIYAQATASQNLTDWISSHIHMWETFGGVTTMVVPDNLKSGVHRPHRYDPDINANYQHFSEHYGVAIVPARVRHPKDKAKVENAVAIVTRHVLAPLRDITFTSLADMNRAIQKKIAQLNQQPFQKMQTTRQELFDRLDKPALKPLPPTRYQYVDWVKAKVHIDYHVAFHQHFYSVPYANIHRTIEIRATANTVECFYEGQRIAVHVRSDKQYGYTTQKAHMPPAHRAHAEWSPERMRRWAQKIGPKTQAFIERVIASRPFPEQAYRACLGILRLGTGYGEERLEKAAAIALAQGMTRYREIEALLKNQMDRLPETTKQPPSSSTISVHENIRGATYYQ